MGVSFASTSSLISLLVLILLLFVIAGCTTGSSSTSRDEVLEADDGHSNQKMGSFKDYSSSSQQNLSSILVFGDSTVDPGNNNYLLTILKCNYSPYGQNFPNHIPTGRFTDGKLVTDFVASYVGIKDLVPPYLDTGLSFQELMTGVSFASGASGYDPLTAKLYGVISLQQQLEYFKEYKAKLQAVIGNERTEDHIRRTGFIVSTGTDDFVLNYYAVPIRHQQYSITDFQQFLLQNARDFLQGLWDLGARTIGVVGLPPVGCLPLVISLKTRNITDIPKRVCVEEFSEVSKEYNNYLKYEIASMQQRFEKDGGLIVYADIYTPLLEIIHDHDKYGFTEETRGCCGTGVIETVELCNPLTPVCPDASKYVFWDSVHPTERTYYILFESLRNIIPA